MPSLAATSVAAGVCARSGAAHINARTAHQPICPTLRHCLTLAHGESPWQPAATVRKRHSAAAPDRRCGSSRRRRRERAVWRQAMSASLTRSTLPTNLTASTNALSSTISRSRITGRDSKRTPAASVRCIVDACLNRVEDGLQIGMASIGAVATALRFALRRSARDVQNACGCRSRATRAKARDRSRCVRVDVALPLREEFAARSLACPDATGAVWTAIAPSHADASAFFTPNDDNGSMNEPASPISRNCEPAYRVDEYSEASQAHTRCSVAPSGNRPRLQAFAISAR